MVFARQLFILAFLLFGGLASAEDGRVSGISVYLISRGFHTGIVIPAASSSARITVLGEKKDGFAEFGWGEAYYYQAQSPGCLSGARALFLPNRSVVRTELLPDFERVLVRSDFAVRFDLTEEQFRKLCRFIDDSFAKKEGALIRESVETSRVSYYTSVHTYSIFNTCNTWAAEALEAAGTGVSSDGVILASRLYSRAKEKGIIVKESR